MAARAENDTVYGWRHLQQSFLGDDFWENDLATFSLQIIHSLSMNLFKEQHFGFRHQIRQVLF